MSGCTGNWCSPNRSSERPDDHDGSRERLRRPQEGVGPVVQGTETGVDALRRTCRCQGREVRPRGQRPRLGRHGSIGSRSPKATALRPRAGHLPPCRGQPARGAPPGRSRQAGTAPAAAAHPVAGGDPEGHDGGAVSGACWVAHPAGLPLHYWSRHVHRDKTIRSDRPAAGGPGTGRSPDQERQAPQGPPSAPARERTPCPRWLPRGAETAGRTRRDRHQAARSAPTTMPPGPS